MRISTLGIIIKLLFPCITTFSQTEFKILKGCAFSGALINNDHYTFEPSIEADSIISEIMSMHSLPKNFIIKASNVSNALAVTDSLTGQRFILYNTSFLEKFKKDANTRWAAYSVLAHEVGHHLCNHDFGEKNPRRRKLMELEADRFSGGTLCLLGATLEESQAGLNKFAVEEESSTHPAKMTRLEAIASEWKKKKEWMEENGIISKISSMSEDMLTTSNAKCDYCPEMISIVGTSGLPNGSFLMGNNKSSYEKPTHSVVIQDFEIGKYEVSNSEFCRFMSDISSRVELDTKGKLAKIDGVPIFILRCTEKYGQCDGFFEMMEYEYGTTVGYEFKVKPGYEDFACAMVTWYGAKAYADWLSHKTGLKYRLPTESEWEFAAKGGINAEKFQFCGSDNPDEVAWYKKNVGVKKQFAVGKKKPNSLGIHDMSGLLWEWCEDCWNDNYVGHPSDGSAWLKGNCTKRVVRGGSFNEDATLIKVTVKGLEDPKYSDPNTGFRLVREKR